MRSVDNRIVNMTFNNSRFEQNAKQTMSTLDRLKEKLKFKDGEEGFENLRESANSFNLNHMALAIDNIGEKFTMLGILGQRAMNRLADSAVDAALRIGKSLTVDQVGAGMTKYTEETNSVQTLVAATTQAEGGDAAKATEKVYKTLDKVAEYSDATSYSYTQMTGAVSTFVAAGWDLEKAEVVIEGVANAAARAGVSVSDAEVAFRNFSDAASKGYFAREDWKSLQLIHMDTREMREEFIKAAKAAGKLDEEGYLINQKTGKRDKRNIKVTADNFVDTLQYKWLDKDVMEGTMTKYADRTEGSLGEAAFQAASLSRSFEDVRDTINDTISSGWRQTFKLIFGDIDEATELFTKIADTVSEAVGKVSEFRNSVLQIWHDYGGRGELMAALESMWNGFMNILGTVGKAFGEAFGILSEDNAISRLGHWLGDISKKINDAAKRFENWTKTSNKFQTVVRGIASVFHIVWNVVKGVFGFFRNIWSQLKPAFDELGRIFAIIAKGFTNADKKMSKSNGITTFFGNLANYLKPVTDLVVKFFGALRRLITKIAAFAKFNPKFQAFWKGIKEIFAGILKFIPQLISGIVEFGKRMYETFKNSKTWEKMKSGFDKYIKPLGKNIGEFAVKAKDAMVDFFTMDTSGEKTLWDKIKKRFSAFDGLGEWIKNKWEKLKEKIPFLGKIAEWWNTSPFIAEIKNFFAKIKEAVTAFFSKDFGAAAEGGDSGGGLGFFKRLKERFKAAFDLLKPYVEEKIAQIKEWFQSIDWGKLIRDAKDTLLKFVNRIFKKEGSGSSGGGGGSGEKVSIFRRIAEWVWDKISSLFGGLFGGSSNSGSSSFLSLTPGGGSDMTRALPDTETLGDQVGGFFDKVKAFLARVGDWIKGTFSGVWTSVAGWLRENGDVIDMILNFALKIAAIGLIRGVTKAVNKSGGVLDSISGFIDHPMANLKSSGEKEGKTSFTTSLIKIALALVGVAAAVYILYNVVTELAKMDADAFWKGFWYMTAIFGELLIAIVALNLVRNIGKKNKDGSESLADSLASIFKPLMVAMAVSKLMKVFLSTVEKLEGIDKDALIKAGIVMGGIMLLLGLMSLMAKNDSSSLGGAIKPLVLAMAIGKLTGTFVSTCMNLKTIDWGDILKAGVVMAAVAIILGIAAGLSKNDSSSLGGAMRTMMIATVVMKLVEGFIDTTFQVKLVEWDDIWKTGLIMGGIMLLLGLMMLMSKNDSGSIGAAAKPMALAMGVIKLIDVFVGLTEKFKGVELKSLETPIVILLAITLLLALVLWAAKDNNGAAGDGKFIFFTATGVVLLLKEFTNCIGTLSQHDEKKVLIAGLMLIGIVGMLALVMHMASKLDVKGMIGLALALAGMIILVQTYANALDKVKNIDPLIVIAFGAALVLLVGAVTLMMGALLIFSQMSPAAAAKGAIVMLIAAAAIGAAIGLIMMFVNQAIRSFGDTMALVGADLSIFYENVKDIDFQKVGDAIQAIYDLSAALVEVGLKDYRGANDFKTCLSRIGATLKIFNMQINEIEDMQKIKDAIANIKEMADMVASIPDNIGDKSSSIANIGGAIKIFAASLQDDTGSVIDLEKIPTTEQIRAVFGALEGAFSEDENMFSDMDAVAEFASEDKGKQLTNFAIGLANIATALSLFAESCKNANYTYLDKGINIIGKLKTFDIKYDQTATMNFIGFSVTVHEESGNLNDFADDIVVLGTALEAFAGSCKNVNIEEVDASINAIGKIKDINNALPSTGGLKAILIGEQSLTNFSANMKNLGLGAKSFSESIAGGKFNETKGILPAATMAILSLAQVNAALPLEGGVRGWFAGNRNLSKLAEALPILGGGIVAFSDALKGGNISDPDKILAATEAIRILAEANAKMPESGGFRAFFGTLPDAERFAEQLVWLAWGINHFALSIETGEIQGSSYHILHDKVLEMATSINLIAEAFMILAEYSDAMPSFDSIAKPFRRIGSALNEFRVLIKTNQHWRDSDQKYAKYDVNDVAAYDEITMAADAVSKICEAFDTIVRLDGKMPSFNDVAQPFRRISSALNQFRSYIKDGYDEEIKTYYASLDGMDIATQAAEVIRIIVSAFTDIANLDVDGLDFAITSDAMLLALMQAFELVNGDNVIVNTTVTDLLSYILTIIGGYEESFATSGSYLMRGLKNGIVRNRNLPINAVRSVCLGMVRSANFTLSIRSPSKEFEEIGMYSDIGLAKGLLNYVDVVDSAAEQVGRSTLDSALAEIKALSEIPVDDIGQIVSIKPVIDSSDISYSAGYIDSLFGDNHVIGFDTKALEAQAQLLALDYTYDLSTIAQHVQTVNDKLEDLSNHMSRLRIVLNSGVLVGQIASEVDRALGNRAKIVGRGN